MENCRRKQVLEILDYWKIVEFWGQIDIREESQDNRKIIQKIRNGEKVKTGKIEVFFNLITSSIQIDKAIEKDAEIYKDFPIIGGDVFFSIGRIYRNNIVSYLEKYIKNPEERPEIAYPKESAIAWCSFKTDREGFYLQKSFQLSPILWAISVWEKCRVEKNLNFTLNPKEYNAIVEKIDEMLQNQNVSQFLQVIYAQVYEEWVRQPFPEINNDAIGFFEYNRYTQQEERNKDENSTDYTDLGKNFFLNDILLLMELINSEKFGDRNAYEKKVISYILAGYEKTNGMGDMIRTIISPSEPEFRMREFFEEILHVDKAPLGKWPARFMPVLMQQVAVNIAIDYDKNTPIFSVNGPPGTGKTTLLKEIVASNIVERAMLLAENGEDPDTLFVKHSFTQGPLEAYGNTYFQYAPNYYEIKNDKINDYGVLVASCNNAAVENITMDLPKGKDILESLEPSGQDDEGIKIGLKEVRDLFDIDKSEDIEDITIYGKSREEKDIFFTRYANHLLESKDSWGLISAPFGNRSNIKKYCNKVLKPFIEEYKTNNTRNLHKQKYIKQREIFLKQYRLVEGLKEELEHLCTINSMISAELQNLSVEESSKIICELESKKQQFVVALKSEQLEVMQLEESRPRGLFSKYRDTPTRDGLIAEHKNNIETIKKSLIDIDKKLEDFRRLQNYHELLIKYSVGEKKLTPIDTDFMEKYKSTDEVLATEAQTINPWFTAQYNREREKLFLYACKLHKEFVASSKCMRQNIINLMIAWNMFDECNERMQVADRKAAMPYMLQSIFLLTPVISTTFASAQIFLGDIEESGILGTLIVDEAGQAQPQTAIGAMFRCRKAIIVGDPKQIEPVVTAETDMVKQLVTAPILAGYKDKRVSVQGFADYINPYGTFLGEEEEKEWVGCPLVVHRRCIDPMYSISNVLSYNGTMKKQTSEPKADREATFILKKSCWIDVSGTEESGAKNHFVKAQGEVVLKLLEEKFKKDKKEIPNLFIITPFTSVKMGMIDMIKKSDFYKTEDRVEKWLKDNNVGTVHTFQGQGTDEVIFLLGCDINATGAANWVNKNIVNVAATRAKFRFYLIGDKDVWTCKPVKVAREHTDIIVKAEDLKKIIDGQGICPECGKILIKKSGKYGDFLGCSGFPDCKHTESLKLD